MHDHLLNLLRGIAIAALLAGCTPAALDAPCTENGACGSGMCLNGKCTRACAAQGDCPTGFDCVLQSAADGEAGGVGATCSKSTYDATPAATGGFGADCSAVSTDPKGSDPCDKSAASPCAAGFTCLSSLRCDPLAYCTKACSTDFDCPPSFFCGTHAGRICTADGDCNPGDTCQAPPGGDGTVKLCTGPARCEKREQCSPCGADDQCPVGFACAVDDAGYKFCGQVCDADHNCPQPENDEFGSPLASQFLKCVASNGPSGKSVCRPTAGTCKGPSAIADFSGKTNTICSSCREGTPSDCPNGLCYQGEFSRERFCTQPCTAHVTQKGTAMTVEDDTCPMGSHCYAGISCATTCAVKGYCAADSNLAEYNRDYQQHLTTYIGFTCYPLPM